MNVAVCLSSVSFHDKLWRLTSPKLHSGWGRLQSVGLLECNVKKNKINKKMTWAQTWSGSSVYSLNNHLSRLEEFTLTSIGWLGVGATDRELINRGQSIFSRGCEMTAFVRCNVHQHWKFCSASKSVKIRTKTTLDRQLSFITSPLSYLRS